MDGNSNFAAAATAVAIENTTILRRPVDSYPCVRVIKKRPFNLFVSMMRMRMRMRMFPFSSSMMCRAKINFTTFRLRANGI